MLVLKFLGLTLFTTLILSSLLIGGIELIKTNGHYGQTAGIVCILMTGLTLGYMTGDTVRQLKNYKS